MNDPMNRDNLFYRIAHIDLGLEDKSLVLDDLKGVDNPNFQDCQGTSYLHMACQVHSLEAISILLNLGADPNIKDAQGFSPLLSALGSINDNNPKILKLMLKNGLNLEQDEAGMALVDHIKAFNNDEYNTIISEYSRTKNEERNTISDDHQFICSTETNKHIFIKSKKELYDLIDAVNQGKEDYITISTLDGYIQLYGYNGKFIVEIRINMNDGFRTFELINEGSDETARTVLITPFGTFTPISSHVVSKEKTIIAVDYLYCNNSATSIVNNMPCAETTVETKHSMGIIE